MSSTEGPPSKMNWRGSACKNLQETVVQLLEKTAQGRGIQGVVGSFGEAVDPPDAGIDLYQPALLELSRLVSEPHVVFRPLVLA